MDSRQPMERVLVELDAEDLFGPDGIDFPIPGNDDRLTVDEITQLAAAETVGEVREAYRSPFVSNAADLAAKRTVALLEAHGYLIKPEQGEQ